MKQVREFYSENAPDLSGIPSLSHRQFRLHLPKRGFRKLSHRIRTAEELQQVLVKKTPLDVYYSVGRWLNPTVVGPVPLDDDNSFGRYSRNLFLGADLVFDIDVPPLSRKNLAKAQAITKSLISFLSEHHNLKPRYLAFSGGKGFHAVYDCPFTAEIADPLKREKYAQKERKKLADEIVAEGIEIDAPITYDTRRIFRVPGTLNSKTGYLCRCVSEAELDAPVRKLLKSTPRVSYSPGILARGNDAILRIVMVTAGRWGRSGVSPSPTFPSEMYASYVTNVVCGVKDRYVPFFTWPKRRAERLKKRIARVQEHYSLGPVYLFDADREITGLSLRTFQRRRCEKIVKAAGSLDAYRFRKYKRQFMRVGSIVDSGQQTVLEAPRYMETIPADGTKYPVSKPHHEFFTAQGLELEHYPESHGSEQVQITYCILEN